MKTTHAIIVFASSALLVLLLSASARAQRGAGARGEPARAAYGRRSCTRCGHEPQPQPLDDPTRRGSSRQLGLR